MDKRIEKLSSIDNIPSKVRDDTEFDTLAWDSYSVTLFFFTTLSLWHLGVSHSSFQQKKVLKILFILIHYTGLVVV